MGASLTERRAPRRADRAAVLQPGRRLAPASACRALGDLLCLPAPRVDSHAPLHAPALLRPANGAAAAMPGLPGPAGAVRGGVRGPSAGTPTVKMRTRQRTSRSGGRWRCRCTASPWTPLAPLRCALSCRPVHTQLATPVAPCRSVCAGHTSPRGSVRRRAEGHATAAAAGGGAYARRRQGSRRPHFKGRAVAMRMEWRGAQSAPPDAPDGCIRSRGRRPWRCSGCPPPARPPARHQSWRRRRGRPPWARRARAGGAAPARPSRSPWARTRGVVGVGKGAWVQGWTQLESPQVRALASVPRLPASAPSQPAVTASPGRLQSTPSTAPEHRPRALEPGVLLDLGGAAGGAADAARRAAHQQPLDQVA